MLLTLFLSLNRSPLPHYVEVPHTAGYPVVSDPHMFQIPIQTPGCNNSTLQPQSSYLSFAPPEVSIQFLNPKVVTW